MTNRGLRALTVLGAVLCAALLGSEVSLAEGDDPEARYELSSRPGETVSVVDLVSGTIYEIDVRRRVASQVRLSEGKVIVRDLRYDLTIARPQGRRLRLVRMGRATAQPEHVLFDPYTGRVYAVHDSTTVAAYDPVGGAFVKVELTVEDLRKTPATPVQDKLTDEGRVIGLLKIINTAQSLFREGDKEQDQNFDYGTLRELSEATLVDSVLGSGTKHGYLFEVDYSQQTSEFLWFATASPQEPGPGRRYFCMNQAGLVFYDTDQPIPMNNVDCRVPEHALPVGR